MTSKVLDSMRDDLMVQQQVGNDWQHMVGVICLNQTGRKKVKKILPEFFKKFPNAFRLILLKQVEVSFPALKSLNSHLIFIINEKHPAE